LGRLTQKSVLDEEAQHIQNSTEARNYLEQSLLIVPPGEVPTAGLLATALHQVAAYKGVSRPAVNAIRAVAFLLEEVEENALHQTVRESVTVQLNELASDLKDYITDATQRIDSHMESRLEEISEATKTLVNKVKTSISDNPPPGNHNTGNVAPPLDYRRALMNPPPHADPRLAAKEGIRIRQFMVEGVTRDSRIGKMTTAEAKKAANKALENAGSGGHKARSVTRQGKEGLLVEMESDDGAAWLKDNKNAKSFCESLGPGLAIKHRPYSVLAFNASTALDPDNADHIKEIMETNDISENGIASMRWVKPAGRRDRADQRSAHLILVFTNVDDANRAISSGLHICQRRLRVVKRKKEPLRCMKCHQWNHVAWECIAPVDICGTCRGNDHWTKDCTNREMRHCVSCNTDDHVSWSRSCPTFLKKCDEMDRRTPENSLPFYLASDPWTWSPMAPTQNPYARTQGYSQEYPQGNTLPPPILPRGRNQQERIQNSRDAAPNGRPYERLSWNRASSGQTDKPPSPPPPPPPVPAPNLTPSDTPEKATNTEPQTSSSSSDFYA